MKFLSLFLKFTACVLNANAIRPLRKSHIDRRWKRLVKFLARCSEMLCGNWYTPSRCATKLRDAMLPVKLLVQKLSPRSKRIRMISPSLPRAHVLASRVRIPISVLCNSQQSHVACMCERIGGPNAQSFYPFRKDIPGAWVSMGKEKVSTIRIAGPKCTGVITVTLRAMIVISQR